MAKMGPGHIGGSSSSRQDKNAGELYYTSLVKSEDVLRSVEF